MHAHIHVLQYSSVGTCLPPPSSPTNITTLAVFIHLQFYEVSHKWHLNTGSNITECMTAYHTGQVQ